MKTTIIDPVLEILLRKGIDSETVNEVENSLILALRGYQVTKMTTEVIPYTELNSLIHLKEFLVTKKVAGFSVRSLKEYNRLIRKFLLYCPKEVEDIKPMDILEFLAEAKQRGVSARTIESYRRYLSSFFTYLVNNDVINKNPAIAIGSFKSPGVIKESFTDIEIELMRNSLKTVKQKAIFEVLLATGCRVGELINIKVENIHGDKIKITGKGNKERNLLLNAKAKIAIKNWISSNERVNSSSEFLFPGAKTGHITHQAIHKMTQSIGQSVGVKAHPHKFRRTCATAALRRGMTVAHISKMLGHSNLNTTMIYLSIDENDLMREYNKYVI